jgi:hypothetical protein
MSRKQTIKTAHEPHTPTEHIPVQYPHEIDGVGIVAPSLPEHDTPPPSPSEQNTEEVDN